MYTPGPGAYYPEYAIYVRHSALRPQPFGSTTPRFDTSCEFRSKMLPAPGSYDLDHVGKHFAQPSVAANSSRLRGFGSVGERFRYTIVVSIKFFIIFVPSCFISFEETSHLT